MLAEDVIPWENKLDTFHCGKCICGKLHTIQYLRSGHPQVQLFVPLLGQPFRTGQSSRRGGKCERDKINSSIEY
jgi:hypothetical protein